MKIKQYCSTILTMLNYIIKNTIKLQMEVKGNKEIQILINLTIKC